MKQSGKTGEGQTSSLWITHWLNTHATGVQERKQNRKVSDKVIAQNLPNLMKTFRI